jgi:hypothetical protein
MISETDYLTIFLLLKLIKSKQISKKQYKQSYTLLYERFNNKIKTKTYPEQIRKMVSVYGGKTKKGGMKKKSPSLLREQKEIQKEIEKIPNKDRIKALEKMVEMQTELLSSIACNHADMVTMITSNHRESLTNQERQEVNQAKIIRTTKFVKGSVLKIAKTTDATKYLALAKANWSDINREDIPAFMWMKFKKSVKYTFLDLPIGVGMDVLKGTLDMAIAPIIFIAKTPKKLVKGGISFLLFTFLCAESYNFVMIPQIQTFNQIPNPTMQTLFQDINQDVFMSNTDGFLCSQEFYCEKLKSIETPMDYYVMSYIPEDFSNSVQKYAIEPAKKTTNVVMKHYKKRTSMATQDIYKRSGAKEYVKEVYSFSDSAWNIVKSSGKVLNTAVSATTSVLNPFNWYSGVKGMLGGRKRNMRKKNIRKTKPKSTKKPKKPKSKNPRGKK